MLTTAREDFIFVFWIVNFRVTMMQNVGGYACWPTKSELEFQKKPVILAETTHSFCSA